MSSGLHEHTHALQKHIHRHIGIQVVPLLVADAYYMLHNI